MNQVRKRSRAAGKESWGFSRGPSAQIAQTGFMIPNMEP